MAGLDSGIKCQPQTLEDIAGIEKKAYAFIIMQIEKPEGEKVEKVITKEKFTREQCLAEVADQNVELKGEETPSWYTFRKHLEKYDIAYGASFIEYKSVDGREVEKLVWVMWNTEKAKLKQKMSYASTKVLQKFKNINLKQQAADADDITFQEIVVGKFGRK